MDNKRIASELNRVAKSLVAEEVASMAGEYENFTGIIDWKGNHGRVRDATFELDNVMGIILKYGTWEDGTWVEGFWHDGTWKYGTWKDGTWRGGTWKKGVWEDGTWKDGIWENGSWRGGKDIKNIYHGRDDSPDGWE